MTVFIANRTTHPTNLLMVRAADPMKLMDEPQIEAFIARWQPSGGAERANYQMFLGELCDVLEVPRPEPTHEEEAANTYVFEKNVVFDHGDGSHSTRRIDLYRRGAYICETKQGVEREQQEIVLSETQKKLREKRKVGHGKRGTRAYDDTMLRAKGQAESYARNLPASDFQWRLGLRVYNACSRG